MELHGIIKNGYAAAVASDLEKVLGHAPRTFARYVDDVVKGVAG